MVWPYLTFPLGRLRQCWYDTVNTPSLLQRDIIGFTQQSLDRFASSSDGKRHCHIKICHWMQKMTSIQSIRMDEWNRSINPHMPFYPSSIRDYHYYELHFEDGVAVCKVMSIIYTSKQALNDTPLTGWCLYCITQQLSIFLAAIFICGAWLKNQNNFNRLFQSEDAVQCKTVV